jgi:small ligand-binding sensory domain FIST
MQFAAALSQDRRIDEAVETVVRQVTEAISHKPIHFAALFASSQYRQAWAPIVRDIRHTLGNPLIVGCTGSGVLGGQEEIESAPALAVVAAHLPDVELHPFHVSVEDMEEPRGAGYWIEKLGATPDEAPVGILLPDPYTCDVSALIGSLNRAYPKMPLIGGLASSSTGPDGIALFLGDDVHHDGATGVLFTGDIQMETVVAQGCRPIGRPFIVTKAQANVILELAGVPAVDVLRVLLTDLTPADRLLAQSALFVGLVMNEQKPAFSRGDFLIRNLIAIDPDSGAIAVGEEVTVGQTVQFQLRDAQTSREDLQQLLIARNRQSPTAGALLFSCLGRGKELYGEPSYDSRMIQAAFGQLPMAGFFCNGEIGPVGGRNFLHGFTSSLALFSPRARPADSTDSPPGSA